MSKLVIHRKYGHKSAGHETFEWNPVREGVVVKDGETISNEELVSMAQAAFTEAMNENKGLFAMMKKLPTDKEYVPTSAFDPEATEIIVFQPVTGG